MASKASKSFIGENFVICKQILSLITYLFLMLRKYSHWPVCLGYTGIFYKNNEAGSTALKNFNQFSCTPGITILVKIFFSNRYKYLGI